MSCYSYKKDILTESYLHYLDHPPRGQQGKQGKQGKQGQKNEQKETSSYSLLNVIAIVMEMVQGRRYLRQSQDDIHIQYLDNTHYWYSLSKPTENQTSSTSSTSSTSISLNNQIEEQVAQKSKYLQVW